MAYMNRPYGSSPYETENGTLPGGAYNPYSSGYRQDYGNPTYPVGQRNYNEVGEVVAEIVSEVVPGYGQQHSRPAESVYRQEQPYVNGAYDQYRREY